MVAALAGGAVALAAGPSAAEDPASAAQDHAVSLGNQGPDPASLTITAGDTVTFTNTVDTTLDLLGLGVDTGPVTVSVAGNTLNQGQSATVSDPASSYSVHYQGLLLAGDRTVTITVQPATPPTSAPPTTTPPTTTPPKTHPTAPPTSGTTRSTSAPTSAPPVTGSDPGDGSGQSSGNPFVPAGGNGTTPPASVRMTPTPDPAATASATASAAVAGSGGGRSNPPPEARPVPHGHGVLPAPAVRHVAYAKSPLGLPWDAVFACFLLCGVVLTLVRAMVHQDGFERLRGWRG